MKVTKLISDRQVCAAVAKSHAAEWHPFAYEILSKETGFSEAVCYHYMERAADAGLIEYGVSLRCGWLTDAGLKLVKHLRPFNKRRVAKKERKAAKKHIQKETL